MKLVSLFVKKDEQKTIHVAVCQTVGIQEETYKKPKKKKKIQTERKICNGHRRYNINFMQHKIRVL